MQSFHTYRVQLVLSLFLGLFLFTDTGYSADPEESEGRTSSNWFRMRRAGWPKSIARWAKCQQDDKYCGYYVGGGATFFGDARCPHEGTWGWDYMPRFTRVRLKWFHGRKYQSGEGQYETDRKNVPIQRFRWIKSRESGR